MADHLSYQPTSGLTYDPNDDHYWDADALQQEIDRTFEICHGCRMCFKYCDSFPSLFSFIDDQHDGDVRKITEPQTALVMDQCFQCKLCEVQCPYTVRDSHEFQLDFPKLVHRYKAQRHREEGSSLRDRLLSDPDRTAGPGRRPDEASQPPHRHGLWNAVRSQQRGHASSTPTDRVRSTVLVPMVPGAR